MSDDSVAWLKELYETHKGDVKSVELRDALRKIVKACEIANSMRKLLKTTADLEELIMGRKDFPTLH